ncbi:MAG: hypothetical protein WC455_16390 [Dehalococcoidia bacterium]
MADENTEKAGAVPADKGANAELPTGTEKDASADSSPEVVMDKDGKPLPWDQQPKWKAARQAEKKLSELLKANDLVDADDLLDLVKHGKAIKGKLADLNSIDDILAKATRLEKYEAYWKEQEEKKRREVEDPDQTIARLESELKRKNKDDRDKEEKRKEAERAKQAISGYESEVSALVSETDIPKEQQGFILEFFGVGNPANDIDITDRKAIKRLIADGIKKKEAYDQAIIQAYIKGKDGIPKVGSSDTAAPSENKPKIMLKDARKMFAETMRQKLGG